jgi:hypothetical protein
MMPFRGQASWVKATSPGGKLTVLVCHPNIKVKKLPVSLQTLALLYIQNAISEKFLLKDFATFHFFNIVDVAMTFSITS